MAQDHHNGHDRRRSLWDILDRLILLQRAGWLSEKPTSVEQLLAEHPELQEDPEACFHLIYNELLIREELGEPVDPEEFFRRFPDFRARLQEQLELHQALQLSDDSSAESSTAERTRWLSPTQSEPTEPAPFPKTERFDPLRRLGSGGMGTVYAAYDRKWQQAVALKTLHRNDTTALFRIKQEFRTLAQLQHPNLVQFYELFATGEQPFFTMELVDGVDFVCHCGSSAPERLAVSSETTREALRQLFAGLGALHHGGKLHCDIKPSNVLVTREGRVVLLDFGLADDRDCPPERAAGPYLRGSLPYLAPEVLAGQAASPAADRYSVGVLLYLVLTGRLPFPGAVAEILAAKHRTEVPSPSETVPEAPEDLDRLCRDLLRHRPQQRPSAAAVASRLGTDSSVFSTPPDPPGVEEAFFGRRRERALLFKAYRRSAAGEPARVLVGGRSGVGKTALLDQFLHRLDPHPGVLVLRGQCYDQESVPFKAFDAVVDRLSLHWRRLPEEQRNQLLPAGTAALAQMFPVLNRVPEVARACRIASVPSAPHALRQQAIEALRELLRRLTEQQRVVVAIDDLQWSDADSAHLLRELFDHPNSPSLLLVACCRMSAEEPSPFRELLEDSPAHRRFWTDSVPLECLSPEDSCRLAQHHLDRRDSVAQLTAARIAEISRGDPFLIAELARCGAGSGDSLQPPHVGRFYLSRLDQLPQGAKRLLEVVAVAAHPLDPYRACQAARLPYDDQQKLLHQLQSACLLTVVHPPESPRQIRIYHDRLRESLVQQMAPERQRRAHLELARVLAAASQPDDERLATHFFAAGDKARAHEHAVRAAEQAVQALAFEQAATMYRIALKTDHGSKSEQRRLRRRLAVALGHAGNDAEAARLYEDLSSTGQFPHVEALQLQRRAAYHYLQAGLPNQGYAILNGLVVQAQIPQPKSARRALLRAMMLDFWIRLRGTRFQQRDESEIPAETLEHLDICWTQSSLCSHYQFLYSLYHHKLFLLRALRVGEPQRLLVAFGLESALSGANLRRATAWAERCRQVETSLPAGTLEGISDLSFGFLELVQGRWKTARDLCSSAGRDIRQSKPALMDRWTGNLCDHYSLWARFFLGEFRELAQRVPELLIDAQRHRDRLGAQWLRMGYCNSAFLASDDVPRAREELQAACRECPDERYSQHHLTEAIAQYHLWLYQRHEPPWKDVLQLSRRAKRSGMLRFPAFSIQITYLRAQCALLASTSGWQPGLVRAARRDARQIERHQTFWGRPLAAILRAQVALRQNDETQAEVLLRQAITGFEDADMAFHAAVARLRHGELVGGATGRAATESARAALAAQGIQNPTRMAAMVAPISPIA